MLTNILLAWRWHEVLAETRIGAAVGWFFLVVLPIAAGAFGVNALLNLLGRSGGPALAVGTFAVVGAGAYAALFVFDMITLAWAGQVPPANIVWPCVTWSLIALSSLMVSAGRPVPFAVRATPFWLFGGLAVLSSLEHPRNLGTAIALILGGFAYGSVAAQRAVYVRDLSGRLHSLTEVKEIINQGMYHAPLSIRVALYISFLKREFTWKTIEHSDDDNLTWSWLRAVEWLNWPFFLSQAFVPFLLLWLDWKAVATAVLMLNYLWVFLVRYRFVNVRAAYFGAAFVRLKWIACPAAAIYLWLGKHDAAAAMMALCWPLLILVFPLVPLVGLLGLLVMIPGQIGRVQNMFMSKLGYEPRSSRSTTQ